MKSFRRDARDVCAGLIATAVFFMLAGSDVFGGLPSQGKAAWERTQVPAAGAEEKDADQNWTRSVRNGDLIISGQIGTIAINDIGMIHSPFLVTQITFRDIQMIKGAPPKDRTFIYPQPPDTLRFAEGARVLVVLNHAGAKSKNFEIAAMEEANPTRLAAVKEAAGS